MLHRRSRVVLFSIICLSFVVACPRCSAESGDQEKLKSLFENRRWFELRQGVNSSSPLFYQGVVACSFGDAQRCEKLLGTVIRSNPKSPESLEAFKRLASFYLTRGRYRKAFAEIVGALLVKPDDADALSVRPLLSILAEYPEQQLSGRRRASFAMQDGGLPFLLNGKQATYWFDTGANFSIMSESEATRLGLQVRSVVGTSTVSTGAKISFRLAVAPQLSFGPIVVKNVAFLVFPDDQPPFNDQPAGSRGLIGLPVLMAFQRFVWSSDKKFEIAPAAEGSPKSPSNLCFDGNMPITQLKSGGQDLTFVLDTGASNTDLFPPFASAFPDVIRAAQKTDSYKLEGVGSVQNRSAAIVDSINFTVGGFPTVLKPANVLLEPTGTPSKFFHGNLGIDLLQEAHRSIFDFKSMTLTLE